MTQFSGRQAFTRRAALAALWGTATLARAQPRATTLVYAGMNGNQLHALRFDAATGELAAIGPVADIPKPRWAVTHLGMIYVANEGSGQGSVAAFRIDGSNGSLAKAGEASSGGAGPTHLWLDAPSKTLLVANFGAGSVSSIALNADDAPGALVSTIKATGSGPHRRQASPHAHGVVVDPSGRFALVPDLGADRVFLFRFDRTTHALSSEGGAFAVPPGSGPRHLVFGRDGRYAYLLNELSAEVMVLHWDAGKLSLVQALPLNAAGYAGNKSGAEIAVSADGRFVYVAERGEHTLVVYAVNAESGALTQIQRIASGGELPWHFALHDSGLWLLVANERSNRIAVFRRDPASGLLSSTAHGADSPSPVSLTFAEQ